MHYEVKDVFLLCENDVDGKICHSLSENTSFCSQRFLEAPKRTTLELKKLRNSIQQLSACSDFFRILQVSAENPKKPRIPHVFALLSAKGSQDTRSRSTKVRLCSFRYQKTRMNRAQKPVKSPVPTVILLLLTETCFLQEKKIKYS